MPALDPAAVQPPVTSPTATVSPETPTDRPAAATSRGRWPWELVWLLVALAIALPAGWPLLTTAGIPVSDDGLFHLYRLDEFARVWPAQAPIVRWSDRFMYGAGFPFFTYYAPLVYYLGTALMALGADTTAAFKLLLALAPVLASVTMYAWTRREFASRPAGLLGAAAYVYAPYFLVDIYRRGSVADCLAFVLLPACLLTARRLIESPSVRRSLVAAATMALLIVTHNAMAFFFLPLLGLYAIGVAGRENLTPRPSQRGEGSTRRCCGGRSPLPTLGRGGG